MTTLEEIDRLRRKFQTALPITEDHPCPISGCSDKMMINACGLLWFDARSSVRSRSWFESEPSAMSLWHSLTFKLSSILFAKGQYQPK